MSKPLICINGGGAYDPKFEREGWATNKSYAAGVAAVRGAVMAATGRRYGSHITTIGLFSP